MKTLSEKNEYILKSITFIFILFPFISHIFGAVSPIVYDFDIIKISTFIILLTIILHIFQKQEDVFKVFFHKDILYFIPFLLIALANSIYNYDIYVIKYAAYVFIFFYFIKEYFLHDYIFKLYVNILVISFLILLIIYFFALNFDLYTPFRIETLEGLSMNSPMQSFNHRAQIFYLLIFDRSDYSGIFDIPRFYGFSREPGFYVMFILPGLLIAYIFKMKLQVFILGFATLIVSSFAGFFVAGLLILMAFIPIRQYKIIFFLLLAVFVSYFLLRGFSNIAPAEALWGNNRKSDYVFLFDKTIGRYFTSLISFNLQGALFLLTKLSFLLILYYYYRKLVIINLKIPFMFFICFLVLINKGTELLSPLLLFYLSFIDYLYVTKMSIQYKVTE